MSYNSYNKPSSRGSRGFGGRGYSGGYRGSGDSSSWRGGGRGSYSGSPSRGRFSSRFEKDSSGYDSRSRYSGLSDGYTTHDDGSHRRYRDESVYSGRDRSHRASSPDRKRMRTEYSHASSMHRSHEYGDDIDYSNRSYSGYSDMESKRVSRGYAGGDDRRGFREDRERMRSDDYQYRKSSALASPRYSSRGAYRGRTYSRGRGVGRSNFKRIESYRGYLTKKRTLDSYGLRKRGGSSKTAEFLQRLKLYRLKSKITRDKSDDEDDKENDEDEEEEEEIEEEVEEEIEEEVTDEDEETEEGEQKEEDDEEKKNGEEDLEEGETNDESKKTPKKKVKKVKKIIKVVKKVKKKKPTIKKEVTSGNEEEGEENKTDSGVQVTIKQDSETRAVNDESVRKNRMGKPFIKLECPHCHGVYVTFREYSNHLFTSKHVSMMTKLTLRLRQTLAKMRVDQRTEQISIDEEAQSQKPNMRTLYCNTCKLNYRSLKAEHIASEKHNAIREFLSPYCKICRISFRSPMFYQHHLCQLDHIRRLDSREKKFGEKEEGKNVDIDQFMILDSVGSGEEESGEESGEEEEEENTEDKKDEPGEGEKEEETDKEPKKKKKKKKAEIKLGIEHCKKIEVYFCDLCKFYLPRVGEEETILTQHCRSRNHLHRYVRYRDDQAARKRNERIKQMREEAKKKEEEEKQKDEPMDVDASEKNEGDEKTPDDSDKKPTEKMKTSKRRSEEKVDDSVWNEVDKDIGALLREVEPGKSSDDEDDSRAGNGRYDRFKLSQKEKHLLKNKVDEDEEEVKEDSKKLEDEEDNKSTAVEVNGDDK